MPKVKMIAARQRRLRVLGYIHDERGADGRAVASFKMIGYATGLSGSQARSVVRYLSDSGLVSVEHRHRSDGGNDDNSYSLTLAGLAVLDQAMLENAEAVANPEALAKPEALASDPTLASDDVHLSCEVPVVSVESPDSRRCPR